MAFTDLQEGIEELFKEAQTLPYGGWGDDLDLDGMRIIERSTAARRMGLFARENEGTPIYYAARTEFRRQARAELSKQRQASSPAFVIDPIPHTVIGLCSRCGRELVLREGCERPPWHKCRV